MPKHLNQSSTLLLQRAIESGITSPKELANLMGNADVETRGFTTMHEDHRYRSAQTLMGAVRSASSRFSVAEIESAVKSQDPKKSLKLCMKIEKIWVTLSRGMVINTMAEAICNIQGEITILAMVICLVLI